MSRASSEVVKVDRHSAKYRNKWGKVCDVLFWLLKVHRCQAGLAQTGRRGQDGIETECYCFGVSIFRNPRLYFSIVHFLYYFVLFVYIWHRKQMNWGMPAS